MKYFSDLQKLVKILLSENVDLKKQVKKLVIGYDEMLQHIMNLREQRTEQQPTNQPQPPVDLMERFPLRNSADVE